MLYLVVHVPISPITLVLACSEFLVSDLHILGQVIGEKNEVEGLEDQGSCKRGLLAEDPRQNLWTKTKHQNAAFGKRRNDRARHHHDLPMVVSSDCGVGTHDRAVWTHDRAVWTHDRASPICPGFFHAFSFSCAIFRFMPFKK